MKDLQTTILSFDNWTQPWKFYEFVVNDKELISGDVELFKEVWNRASGVKFWNFSDLTLGFQACRKFIMDNYDLAHEAVVSIVRAISYQWK